jgi:hypothetical protein
MHLNNAAVLETVIALQGNLVRGDAPAACRISAEFEMGWAYRSCGLDGARRLGQSERIQFPLNLSMLDVQGIPLTWATGRTCS